MPKLESSESATRRRYAVAAAVPEEAPCCPVECNPKYLKAIPAEVIERDYGCGDPSRYLLPGETVLDLGSGTGKICFIASQVVGPTGKVIGVDMTDDMLEVARRYAPVVAENIEHSNVELRKGRIQDLGLDLEKLDQKLTDSPVANIEDYFAVETLAKHLRSDSPMIASDSIDVVVSNCVLNLVAADQKKKLFEDVGFYGVEFVKFESEPWQTHEGIEFRSVTVQAFKGKEGPCLEQHKAVVYRGPFKSILDDDGHRFDRGVRTAVCAKTYGILGKSPSPDSFQLIAPLTEVSSSEAEPFSSQRSSIRQPSETKGLEYRETIVTGDSNCC